MGLQDRAYQQMPPGAHGASLGTPTRLSGAPVVKWLLIINVAVWLLEMVTNNAPVPPAGYQRGHDSLLWNWGHFSVGFAVEQFQIWRFLTFQFLHANGHHLLVNILDHRTGRKVRRHRELHELHSARLLQGALH